MRTGVQSHPCEVGGLLAPQNVQRIPGTVSEKSVRPLGTIQYMVRLSLPRDLDNDRSLESAGVQLPAKALSQSIAPSPGGRWSSCLPLLSLA